MLPLGADLIRAAYAGNSNFAATGSAVITETITAGGAGSFALSVTPTPVSVGAGGGAVLTVKVAAKDGFAQSVGLACGGLPIGVSCSFASPTIAGGGAATLTVQTSGPQGCSVAAGSTSGALGGSPIGARFALAGMVLLLVPGRRRWLRVLVVVAAIAAVTQISGCGNCVGSGTRPGTYTFQLTGTATGSGEVESQMITLNVKS